MASTVQTQRAREIQALMVRRLQSQLRGSLLKKIPHLLFIPSQERKLQKILFRFEFMKEMEELKALFKEKVPPIAVAVAPPLADTFLVNLLAQPIYPYRTLIKPTHLQDMRLRALKSVHHPTAPSVPIGPLVSITGPG